MWVYLTWKTRKKGEAGRILVLQEENTLVRPTLQSQQPRDAFPRQESVIAREQAWCSRALAALVWSTALQYIM